jgi:hypothetical protein
MTTTQRSDAITPGLLEREAAALLPTYARRPVEFVSGHGALARRRERS